MFRKILIMLVMAPLIIAAASSDTSFPVLLMMISLFLIAVMESSNRDEQLDYGMTGEQPGSYLKIDTAFVYVK